MFSTLHGTYFPIKMHFKMSAISLNLDQAKILSSDNQLRRERVTSKQSYINDKLDYRYLSLCVK